MSQSKMPEVPRENILQELENYPLEVLEAALAVMRSREQDRTERGKV